MTKYAHTLEYKLRQFRNTIIEFRFFVCGCQSNYTIVNDICDLWLGNMQELQTLKPSGIHQLYDICRYHIV